MRLNVIWGLQQPHHWAPKCYQLSAVVKYDVSLEKKNTLTAQKTLGLPNSREDCGESYKTRGLRRNNLSVIMSVIRR